MRDKIADNGVIYWSTFFNTMVIEWMTDFVTVTIQWTFCLAYLHWHMASEFRG